MVQSSNPSAVIVKASELPDKTLFAGAIEIFPQVGAASTMAITPPVVDAVIVPPSAVPAEKVTFTAYTFVLSILGLGPERLTIIFVEPEDPLPIVKPAPTDLFSKLQVTPETVHMFVYPAIAPLDIVDVPLTPIPLLAFTYPE